MSFSVVSLLMVLFSMVLLSMVRQPAHKQFGKNEVALAVRDKRIKAWLCRLCLFRDLFFPNYFCFGCDEFERRNVR